MEDSLQCKNTLKRLFWAFYDVVLIAAILLCVVISVVSFRCPECCILCSLLFVCCYCFYYIFVVVVVEYAFVYHTFLLIYFNLTDAIKHVINRKNTNTYNTFSPP